ncbi:type I-F CRISPR-associated endoribonuclease Cas6/Csy4 [Photobacterium lutimaris]|uniref:Type I-F CRISPR-associated endoribonuclease Cas6/Csy4 n=1 Tax=Photobacterium lutimaris TaxID=388278 RepID=A0A2T3J4T2_9GAMM|nr:type I-F CRISPR-associated endoribonuclease Cas6/Csy4 [Photobacterium lutimaris]PSU36289.1 type I-F CRISPR-associated endoribonuclease Cas6/Csy4 [Photobacterium lutimaris]TDR74827.1 CRISPR-associated Csy4 family protein [Photobacterium lutimaris]
MNYYLDIQLQPDLEISAPALMNNLFAIFHRSTAQALPGKIAVSFPRYHRSLGDLLRLHGTDVNLNQLMALPWLKGLRDYIKVSAVQKVPADIKGYRSIYRVQKKSVNNRRKRSITKGWLTEEEALHCIPDEGQQELKLPFLQFKSLSSRQNMRVYVALGELLSEPKTGPINSYGLSRVTTVPWF